LDTEGKGMDYKVLIIEDDEYNRLLYSEVLGGKGCELFFAEDDVSGLAQYQEVKPDLILLDLRFGEREVGLDLFSRIRSVDPTVEVIVISVVRGVDAKIRALKHGAYDYLEKPITRETLSIVVDRVLGKIDLIRELKRLQAQEPRVSHGNIITQSPALLTILKRAETVAETDVTVLLTGETGTGKELVARYILSMSRRRQAPFVPVNCAAIPKELIESELFGHLKGAFTGAVKDKMGIFEEANGGTVFLDEIGKMEIGSQNKLLRFLTEGESKRVGDNKMMHLEVRIIAATNENLSLLVEEQRYLRDLYFRLAVVQFDLPPLRERPEDIPLLADYFLEQYSRKHRKMIVGFEKNALDFLLTRKWPGNVREMENAIESAVIFSTERYLSAKDFQWEEEQILSLDECNLDRHYQMAEWKCITMALSLANGEVSRATRLVGLKDNRKKFYELLKSHKIDVTEYKKSDS
jgi:two-component system, NtrC family, response regulator HydG